MAITPAEARELRASLSEALDPLYAARTGTLPALDAAIRAIGVLHRMDAALVAVVRRGEVPPPFTPEEREAVIASVLWSQRLSGVAVPRDVAERALDAAEGTPLPDIGGEE